MTRAMQLRLAALLVFGISFGYLEAAVVVYLRALYEPIRQKISPRPPNELFPLITTDQLAAADPANTRRLAAEMGREAATIIMLAAMGLGVASNFRQWAAAFLIGFGLWDIFFYIFLHLLLGWPRSLLEWDLLFLIPVPWVGPVIAPVIVAISMVVCGVIAFTRPLHISTMQSTAILAGGAVIVVAFCLDYVNTTAGGMPRPFHWGVFTLGELLALTGFFSGAVSRREVREFQIQPGSG